MRVLARLVLACLIGLAPLREGIAQQPAASTVTFEQFFTVPTQDVSAALMGEMLGPVAWEKATGFQNREPLPIESSDVLEGGIIGLLSSVLGVGCMLLTVIIASVGAITFNVNSALQGAQAAQRYSLFWVPIRTTFSFGMLLPMLGGYTLGQVAAMKVVFLSIGIANGGYNAVLDWFFSGKPTIPINNTRVGETAGAVFLTELCKAALVDPETGAPMVKTNEMTTSSDRNLFSSKMEEMGNPDAPQSWTDTYSASHDGVEGYGLWKGVCGSLKVMQVRNNTVHAPGPTAQSLLNARITAIKQLHTDMRKVVGDLAAIALKTDNSQEPSEAASSVGENRFKDVESAYRLAAQKYRNSLNQATGNAVAELTSAQTTKVLDNATSDGMKQRFRDGGWVMLGSLYWNMHAQNRAISDLVNRNNIDVATPDLTKPWKNAMADRQTYEQVVQAGYSLVERMKMDPETRFVADANSKHFVANYGNITINENLGTELFAQLESVLAVNYIAEKFVEVVSGDGDLVFGLMQVGHFCWNTGAALLVAQGAIGSDKDASDGDSSAAEVATKGVKNLLFKAAPARLGKALVAVLLLLGVPLTLIGFALAFYLPAVPLILWMINVVGWYIQTVKMLFALPIFFAAHAIPEGDGFTGQYARRGWFLMLGCALRPFLLCSGMLVGAILVAIVGWLSNLMMPLMFASMDTTDLPGFMGFLALMAIYTGLMVTLVLKCFSMSHELADEVLQWIGDSATSLGDQDQSARTQQIVSGVIAAKGADILGQAAAIFGRERAAKAAAKAAGGLRRTNNDAHIG